MHNDKEKFLKILAIELEDLDEDIQMLIKESEEKRTSSKISEYVFLENLAILKNEIFGVEGFIELVKQTDTSKYNNTEDLKNDLLKNLKQSIREKGLVEAILLLIERKMNKVDLYLKQQNI